MERRQLYLQKIEQQIKGILEMESIQAQIPFRSIGTDRVFKASTNVVLLVMFIPFRNAVCP